MLSRDEALELIDRMPYIRTINAPNDKILEELFEEAMAKGEPVEWIKVIKTCYVRQHDNTSKSKPISDKQKEAGENAKLLLQSELAVALGINISEVEGYINFRIAQDI